MYLICIAVASFAVLAQPAVAQGANTKLSLTYSGQVLQVGGSQTCPSERQLERVRNEVEGATLRLLRETVLPLLQNFSCGGSTDWRRVAYIDMADLPNGVPMCGGRSPPLTGCVGEDPLVLVVKGSLTPLVVNSITRCVEGSSATS